MTLWEFLEENLKESQVKFEHEAKKQGFDNIYQYLENQAKFHECEEDEWED